MALINYTFIPSLVAEKDTTLITTENGMTTSITLYFTLQKSTDSKGFEGYYILLYYDCFDRFEVRNTEKSRKTKLVVIACCCVAAIILIIIIIICCYLRWTRKAAISSIGVLGFNPYYSGQQVYPQYGNCPFIYQTPNMIYNSPYNVNYNNIPQNVQVIQNDSISQPQAQPSSNREQFSQKFEKPK